MKYIVEVLQPIGASGRRTQIYSNKDDAKAALDSYNYHRPGQPIIALYNGDDGTEALLGVGTGTGRKDYYLIGGEKKEINNYFTNISAQNVILDDIDITELLSEHGPGYDFDTAGQYQRWEGSPRHFGWLGTTAASWATSKIGSNRYLNDGLTVQEAFDAILHGTKIDRSGVGPQVKIEIRETSSDEWTHSLTLNWDGEITEKTILVKLTVLNWHSIIPETFNYNVDPDPDNESSLLQLLTQGGGVYEYAYTIKNIPTLTKFTFSVTGSIYDPAIDSATLYWETEEQEDENTLIVTTGDAIITGGPDLQSYDVILKGSSNIDTKTSTNPDITNRGIKYRKQGTTEWLNLNEITVTNPMSWNCTAYGEINNWEVGVYEYYAYVISVSQGLVKGNIRTFEFQEPGEIKYRFTFGATEGGSCNGYINDSPVNSGEYHDPNVTWKTTAQANSGYEFVRFTISTDFGTTYINNDITSGTLTCSVTVTAIFVKEGETPPPAEDILYTYQVICENEIVTPNSKYVRTEGFEDTIPYGVGRTFSAYPKSGYEFLGWKTSQTGPIVSTDKDLFIDNITEPATLYIVVKEITDYTVQARVEPNGSFGKVKIDDSSVSTIVTRTYPTNKSDDVIITAIPAAGYKVDYWSVNGERLADNPLNNVYHYSERINTEIVIYFKQEGGEPNKYIITVKSANTFEGVVNPTDYINGVEVLEGSSLNKQFTATSQEGYIFRRWEIREGSSSPRYDEHSTITLNYSNIDCDITYIAQFESYTPIVQYNVTYKVAADQTWSNVHFTGTYPLILTYNTGATPSWPSVTLSDSNYEIDYWTIEGQTTPLNTHPTVNANATYTAYLKLKPVEENISYRFSGEGSGNTNWVDAYLTFPNLKTDAGVTIIGESNKYKLWSEFNDRSDNSINLHIPIFINTELKIYTDIDTRGKNIEVYYWDGSSWKVLDNGFNNSRWFTHISGNIYQYNANGADSATDTIGIKYIE